MSADAVSGAGFGVATGAVVAGALLDVRAAVSHEHDGADNGRDDRNDGGSDGQAAHRASDPTRRRAKPLHNAICRIL